MRKLLLILSLGTALCFQHPAFSQILIDKGKVKLDVEAGENILDSIVVHNTSDKSIDVRAYMEDFVYTPPFDAKKKFFPLGTTDYSCGDWISFSPQEFKLGPYGKKELNYSIKVPEDAKGGYYGVLFFEEHNPGELRIEKGVHVVVRVGCLFFLETENKQKEGNLKDISLGREGLEGYFSNEGDTIILSQGTFYVMDDSGMVIDRGEMEKKYLPPGEKTPFTVPIMKDIFSGNYTMILTFNLDEGDVLVKEIDFLKDKTGSMKILEIRD